MNKSEQLIACLEGEIAKRDARIVELESGQSADMFLTLTGEITQLRVELAAIRAQEPALPKGAILAGRSELSLVRNALALDCEQGRPIRGEMLAELDASIGRFDKLYAAPVSEAKAQGVVMPEPDFYWVEADEGSWNSPEEWAQDYYDYNGEKPGSVSFSCAIELPSREYDSFEFDANGSCVSCRLVNPEVARLNAAPVQQVSVPVHWTGCHDADIALNLLDRIDAPDDEDRISQLEQIVMRMGKQFVNSAMLAASQAAPSADAGLVEALRELADQFREAWPEHTGKYHFLIGAGLSIAAHRAKGVV